MTESESTQVATLGPGGEVAQQHLQIVLQALRGDAELPVSNDPEAMSRAIMERILASDSFEEVFAQQNLTPWRSMLGRWVLVKEVHFNRSTKEGTGPPIYAVCDLVDAQTGEAVTVTCGGRNVLAQVIVGLLHGWIGQTVTDEFRDRPVRMIQNDTANGFGALWLETSPA